MSCRLKLISYDVSNITQVLFLNSPYTNVLLITVKMETIVMTYYFKSNSPTLYNYAFLGMEGWPCHILQVEYQNHQQMLPPKSLFNPCCN